ncbi:hypothetical protein [Haloferula sp.]|uniref:hypothetical protein n=1 Tax=Haloferula sp. TaxID=2497595 RepID=UPI003C77EED2
MKIQFALVLTGLIPMSSFGALSITETDGAAPTIYSNGGGADFGGALGAGSFSFDADTTAGTLTVGFTPGGGLGSNIVALYLDTRPGGFGDADMSDTLDAGRNVITNLGSFGNEVFPTGMSGGLPDYAIAFGSFGSVAFELTGGELGFLSFDAGSSVTVNLSDIANPTNIDWFAGLASETLFLSNESFPASATLNASGNPGFDAIGTYEDFNRFVVPEPSVALLGGLGILAMLRRRRS